MDVSNEDIGKVVELILKRLPWLAEKYGEIRKRFSKAETDLAPILIVGPSGAGKTTLLKLLTGEQIDGNYIESLNIEQGHREGFEFTALPGQADRVLLWKEHLDSLAAGKFRGVIFVTSAGYDSFGEGIGLTDQPLYEGEVSAFVDAYSAHCRNRELELLDHLNGPLRDNPGRTWFLTVCTKQDLWFDSSRTIEEHYRAGSYYDKKSKVTDGCSLTRFRRELVFCSLLISNWYTKRKELVKYNCAGYDQLSQIESFERLIEILLALESWEQESKS